MSLLRDPVSPRTGFPGESRAESALRVAGESREGRVARGPSADRPDAGTDACAATLMNAGPAIPRGGIQRVRSAFVEGTAFARADSRAYHHHWLQISTMLQRKGDRNPEGEDSKVGGPLQRLLNHPSLRRE